MPKESSDSITPTPSEHTRMQRFLVSPWFWPFLALLWTGVVLGTLAWNVATLRHTALEMAKNEARVSWNKDVIFRLWGALHGGVYVPVTEQTPPNPYLHVEERDIVTPSGRKLTLLNPAYMTRQIYELARERFGVYGHITSLRPIRPENRPDPWEARALTAFERQGVEEISELTTIDGKPYLRLMRPFVTQGPCLKCHADQGYKVGDVRGGISISIPFAPYLATIQDTRQRLLTAHIGIWLLGLFGIFVAGRRISQGFARLERSEQRLAETLRSLDRAGLGLFVIDAGYTIRSLNQTMSRWFSAKAGQRCYEALAGRETPCPDCRLQEVIEQQQIVHYRSPISRDGRVFDAYASPLTNADGSCSKLEILEDITDILRREEEHQALQEQIRRIQKLEAIGRLAGGIAHDFNNVLTVIKGHCEMGLLESGSDSPTRGNFEAIHEASTRAERLINQLLAFSRRQQPEREPIDVEAFLKDLFDMLDRLVGRKIAIEVDTAPELPVLTIDPSQLEQVLINLVINARDAIQAGPNQEGTISIHCRPVEVDEQTWSAHPEAHPGRYLLIQVEDTGCGIEPSHLNHIFDPFFTTKPVGQGTGLGLATIYGIVKQNGGFILVHSTPDQGSRFEIYWPLQDDGPEGGG